MIKYTLINNLKTLNCDQFHTTWTRGRYGNLVGGRVGANINNK